MLSGSDYATQCTLQLDQYVNDVLNDNRITGRLERLAVERYVKFREVYFFNEQEFQKKLKFCSLLNVKNQLGKISRLVLAPWQLLVIAHLCLYTDEQHTKKLIDTISLSFAGKNGKSTLAVIISLIHLLLEKKVNANILLSARHKNNLHRF